MPNKKASSPDTGTFFETVAQAAFANPFGETRADLDRMIGGTAPSSSADEILHAVVTRLGERIDHMGKTGKAHLRHYEGNQRNVMHSVFLFHVFHRHADEFDELIQLQLKSGNQPCRVSFSREVLNELRSFGFTEDEILRYFSVFYQLRRAFYFIRNGLIGVSPSMKVLRRHLWDCVFTHDIRWFEAQLWNRMEDFSLLLLGETGTGKGSAARAIGCSGFIPFDPVKLCFTESFTQNFVAINLSQYSEGVLESELFGHRKGAFTGAVDNHEGLFSRCAPHGVIFLDEIGDIGTAVQIKLLQVLQERIFFPVGSHEPKRFSGRIIAATNRQLDELRQEEKFRNDLYFRLCSDEIVLPPLRQRLREDPQELELLLAGILSRVSGDAGRTIEPIKNILRQDVGPVYPWPGNVRELEQAVKRIILTGHYQGKKTIQKGGRNADQLLSGIQAAAFDAETLLSEYCASIFKRSGTYEEVARITKLDRRTAKKYVHRALQIPPTA